jgi:hypothetical protein
MVAESACQAGYRAVTQGAVLWKRATRHVHLQVSGAHGRVASKHRIKQGLRGGSTKRGRAVQAVTLHALRTS